MDVILEGPFPKKKKENQKKKKKKKGQMKESGGVGVSSMEAKLKKMHLKGSSSGSGGGVDDKFKRKQQMKKGSSSCVGVRFGPKPDPNIHPLLWKVGWRVMVIDDRNPNFKSEFQMVDRLHLLFFYSGFKVRICDEPSRALSDLKENKNVADFVICNIHMKGMDKATLFELVGLKDVLVIMMSNYMDMSLVTQGINHGACSFVLKPDSWEDIQNISSLIVKKKKYPSMLPWKLHKKFDEVVEQLGGLDEAVPEKILKLMDAENIIPLEVIVARLQACRRKPSVAVPSSGTKEERQDAEAALFNVDSQT